jgi:CBS domain-containing protein
MTAEGLRVSTMEAAARHRCSRGSPGVLSRRRRCQEPSVRAPIPAIPRLDLVSVEEVMHSGIIWCDPGTPLTAVARVLADERIHCVVVSGLERTPTGQHVTWGVLSDLDLMRALDADDTSPTAGSVATGPLITVEPADTVARAVALMADRGTTHVVVVRNDFPVGIVSALDVARAAGGS